MKLKMIFGFFMVLLLGACSQQSYEPKSINAETDICKICNMSITNENYAGQIILKNGDYEVFDDIGCLMEYVAMTNNEDIGAAFIKDSVQNKWLNVEKATYIYSSSYWTPMNYGVLAFETTEAAENWIDENGEGEFLTYDQLHNFNWGIHH